ncbi:MAG: hypothetical protein CMH83_06015 [Nocardioides sp.]|nr:hypothetical protein [Nocardioides sp.]
MSTSRAHDGRVESGAEPSVLFSAPVAEAFAAAGRLRALGVPSRLLAARGPRRIFVVHPRSGADSLITATTVTKWAPHARRVR